LRARPEIVLPSFELSNCCVRETSKQKRKDKYLSLSFGKTKHARFRHYCLLSKGWKPCRLSERGLSKQLLAESIFDRF
jgi:hypothetical protein